MRCWLTFGVPFGDHFGHFGGTVFASIFRPHKSIKKGRGSSARPLPVLPHLDTLPPSSDSSPLVKPLRGAPDKHRTPRQSQSFPEQQTSVLSQQKTSILSQQKTRQLPASGRLLLCLLLRQDRCLLLRQDRCLLLRQDRSLLLRQDRCLLMRQDRCKILRQGWSRRLKSTACRSNRDFWNSSSADWGRPAETGGVPGYGVKHPRTDPPHPRAKARMTAVKQTPSNDLGLICSYFTIHEDRQSLGK